MTAQEQINLTEMRGEGASLRHAFRKESHPNRPDVIVHHHDVPNCRLCALIDAVEAAARASDREGDGCPHRDASQCTNCEMEIYYARQAAWDALARFSVSGRSVACNREPDFGITSGDLSWCPVRKMWVDRVEDNQ